MGGAGLGEGVGGGCHSGFLGVDGRDRPGHDGRCGVTHGRNRKFALAE
jgi:hypothetical protein